MTNYDKDTLNKLVVGTKNYHGAMTTIIAQYLTQTGGFIPDKMPVSEDYTRNPVKWQSRSIRMNLGVEWIYWATELWGWKRSYAAFIWRYGQIQKFPNRFMKKEKIKDCEELLEWISYICKNPIEFWSVEDNEVPNGLLYEKLRVQGLRTMSTGYIWYKQDDGTIELDKQVKHRLVNNLETAITWVYAGSKEIPTAYRLFAEYMGWTQKQP